MKKVFFFIFLTGIFLFSCNYKNLDNNLDFSDDYFKNYNNVYIQSELQKKFMAVKVLEICSENAIDVFGNPLIEGNWYGVCNLNHSFFPIIWKDEKCSFIFTNLTYSYFYDELITKERTLISASNGMTLGVPVYVEILILGPNIKVVLTNLISLTVLPIDKTKE